MYILDNDILSVLDGSHSNKNVLAWFASIDETEIYLTATTIFERAKNTARLAKKGKARDAAQAEQTLTALKTTFADRILPLDANAAEDWGKMIGQRERNLWDTGAAAIAKQCNYYIATRNVSDFTERGATVVNPFESPVRVIKP